MREYLPKRRLTGGLRLEAHKEASTAQPIERGLLPRQLILSTRQHRGPAAEPVVAVGQRVRRGELLAAGELPDATNVHASSSGTVTAIAPRPVPSFTSTATETCIVIATDGADLPVAAHPPWPASRHEQLALVRAAGIVGLGGAVYPTAAKLSMRGCRTLVVNGAECEPYISCDDMLMREAAREIVDGTRIMGEIVAAELCVIAIERDKPEAIDAVRAALDELDTEHVQLAELPSIYPAGGERQLIEVLTGTEVPQGRYPIDIGFICQNVGTAYAISRLARLGEPLTSRIVTVTGRGVVRTRNVEVPIGTPIGELVEFCGGYAEDVARLIHGGSMMGFALPSDDLPVTKGTNCIVAAVAEEVRQDYAEWQCIRCGECSIACPVRLQPQDLLLAARGMDVAVLDRLGLADCIECGCCDVICPSHIPLTETFRRAKAVWAEHAQREALSAASEARFEQRELRLHKSEAAARSHQDALVQAIEADPAARAEAIRAAVERARRRKVEDD